jgi:SAM-dependent methyltransferase
VAQYELRPEQAFRRYDETADEQFYEIPRLVTHIDEYAIAAVTQLYRERFPVGGAILDLMSSWVSHLPPEVEYRRVTGLGMNAEELAANPRLTDWTVKNLNRSPLLPFHDAEFDAAAICVSIQYLVQPAHVLREIGRVIAPGGPLVVAFSNRCFPTKAVAVWQMLDDGGHGRLVEQYFRAAGNWTDVEILDRSAAVAGADPLYAVVGRSLGPAPPEAGGSRAATPRPDPRPTPLDQE